MGQHWERISKWSAWLLVIVLVLEFISGYGISHFRIFRVIIGKADAFKLHQTIQPVAVFFVLAHLLPQIRKVALRFGVKKSYLLDAVLFILLFGLSGGSLYLFFY